MNKGIYYIFFILLSVVIISCDSNRLFDSYTEIPNQKWNRFDKLKYEVEITDNTEAYNLFFNVRNSGKYNYSNLFVFFKSISPSGMERIDTIEVKLCDDRGKWLGKGLGDLWDTKVEVRKNIVFPEKGKYIFEVEQAMREEVLEYISDIGIRIEYFNKK